MCEIQKSRSPYYYLSKYRSELMGVALLCVVWFHSSFYLDFFQIGFLNRTFLFIKDICYGGVDIFLLLSGMGIYVSLEKNDISKYIKNRIIRITPVWWTYLAINVIFGRLFFEVYFTKLEMIGFATFTGFWLDMKNRGNWFVYAIMFFYLISPVIFSLIKNSRNKKLMFLILIAISLAISLSFLRNFKLIVFSRLPVYIIGMYTACALRDIPIKRIHWIILITGSIFGIVFLWVFYTYYYKYLWPYGLWWYPFIVIAPMLSLLITKCFDSFQKILKPVMFVLSLFGKASLEILLVSDYLFANFSKLNINIINSHFTSFFVILISLPIGLVFHHSIETITKKIHQKKIIKMKGRIQNEPFDKDKKTER